MKTNNYSLFLQQSYKDTWDDYQRSLYSESLVNWDYVILTASNDEQAKAYKKQIDVRKRSNLLPKATEFEVISDPQGKRVGSGGATLNVLRFIKSREESFKGKRILCIHSGGDSKRVPQYSACGKIFSPVPRELPDNRRSTLFDEFIIGLSSLPSRIKDGMLTVSGDVLLLFNPLQIDAPTSGASCISIKEDVETGKNHGVFTIDDNGNVYEFLHKQTVETLREHNAVNEHNKVDVDTGAILFCSDLLESLYSLIDTDEKFSAFVNDRTRISFYADFLYPLASHSTEEKYYKEKPEGDYSEQLYKCRKQIWEKLQHYSMKLLRLSPASFIHFGTTKELKKMMCQDVDDYSFLGWEKSVFSNIKGDFAVNNSIISENAEIGKGCYIEDSIISGNTLIGNDTVVSHISASNRSIPSGIVLHGIKLQDGKYVVRIYGVNDNPKDTKLFDRDFREYPLWDMRIYKPCDTLEEALDYALDLYENIDSVSFDNSFESLSSSFNNADTSHILSFEKSISEIVFAKRFLGMVCEGKTLDEVKTAFENVNFNKTQIEWIEKNTEELDNRIKTRVLYYIGKLIDDFSISEKYLKKAFKNISDTVCSGVEISQGVDLLSHRDYIVENLPLRVNFCGGWSDTPPYCNENGGAVVNAAVLMEGQYPVEVIVKHIDKPVYIFESKDMNAYEEFDSLEELQDCHSPYNSFALHKAVLISCGVVPAIGAAFEEVVNKTGGLFLSTRMRNIPKGSGLGTSSILACACVKAVYKYFNTELSDKECAKRTMCVEQLMSTGGGWQDQVGGMLPGIKLITSLPGNVQDLQIKPISVSQAIKNELSERFALIYTGQRRLARNLLREVVGNYIGGKQETVEALKKTKILAIDMANKLELGKFDGFVELLNAQFEYNKKIDNGCTNTCIDQIFLSIDDLIDAKMICGAGGGGFLQVIMKKGVSKKMLSERIYEVFQDSGVCVWDAELIF